MVRLNKYNRFLWDVQQMNDPSKSAQSAASDEAVKRLTGSTSNAGEVM